MKLSKSSVLSILALSIAASLPTTANAGFSGDTATLTFNDYGFVVAPTFTPATVGDGVEFVGTGTDVFGQKWTFAVDVSDAGVKLNWTGSIRSYEGNLSSSPDAWLFGLSFANSTVPALTLTSFTSLNSGRPSGLTSVTGSASNAVTFGFQSLYATDTYTFTTAVPEPETYAMMLAGLGLICSGARRRKSKQA
jgi:hypothetical protein